MVATAMPSFSQAVPGGQGLQASVCKVGAYFPGKHLAGLTVPFLSA